MSANNDLVVKLTGASTLERAKFGPGMLLRHDDLEQLNVYPRELSRLLFRSLFGCGVVCGLVVQPPEDKCDKIWVRVSSGLALDCSGDPIYVPKDSGPLSFDPKCEDKPLWVILCGKTTACSPRTSACASDDEESSPVPSREKDGYEIRIVRTLPKCICACIEESATDPAKEGASAALREGASAPAKEPETERECPCVGPDHPCYRAHYEGKCGCDAGKDCDCCCSCVVLARLEKPLERPWTVTHKVRRVVRPVLMRDPEVARERKEAAAKKAEQTAQETAAAAAVEKIVAERVAADRSAQRLQQLAKQGEAPVVRERARSSRSGSSK